MTAAPSVTPREPPAWIFSWPWTGDRETLDRLIATWLASWRRAFDLRTCRDCGREFVPDAQGHSEEYREMRRVRALVRCLSCRKRRRRDRKPVRCAACGVPFQSRTSGQMLCVPHRQAAYELGMTHWGFVWLYPYLADALANR